MTCATHEPPRSCSAGSSEANFESFIATLEGVLTELAILPDRRGHRDATKGRDYDALVVLETAIIHTLTT